MEYAWKALPNACAFRTVRLDIGPEQCVIAVTPSGAVACVQSLVQRLPQHPAMGMERAATVFANVTDSTAILLVTRRFLTAGAACLANGGLFA